MYFRKSQIIIIIDETVASVLHVRNKELLSSQELESNNSATLLALQQFVIQNKDAEVYIIYHAEDKDLQHHFLDIPRTSDKDSVLKNIFPTEVLNTAIFSDLITLDTKTKHYLSVLGRVNNDLLGFTEAIDKQFKGFAIAALECRKIIEVLSYGICKLEVKDRFDLLFMSNLKTSVLRVVIYNNGVFFQEKTIQIPQNKNLEIYTGYIKEYYNSTISNLRVEDASKTSVNAYFVVPSKIKEILSLDKFNNNQLIALSPYELGVILGLDWMTKEEEVSGYTLLAYNIITYGMVSELYNTDNAIKRNRLSVFNFSIDIFRSFLTLVFITYIFIINDQVHNLYFKYKGYINSENILRSEVDQLLQKYYEFQTQQKINIESAVKALEIDYESSDIETIYYIFSIHNNDDEVINIDYNTFDDGKIPSIKVRLNNTAIINERNKSAKPQIYANVEYEYSVS